MLSLVLEQSWKLDGNFEHGIGKLKFSGNYVTDGDPLPSIKGGIVFASLNLPIEAYNITNEWIVTADHKLRIGLGSSELPADPYSSGILALEIPVYMVFKSK